MQSKHIHFYPEIGFHIKDRSTQKVGKRINRLKHIILIIKHIKNT